MKCRNENKIGGLAGRHGVEEIILTESFSVYNAPCSIASNEV